MNKQVFIMFLFGLEKHFNHRKKTALCCESNLIQLEIFSGYFMLIVQANKKQRGRGIGHVTGQWDFDLKSIM